MDEEATIVGLLGLLRCGVGLAAPWRYCSSARTSKAKKSSVSSPDSSFAAVGIYYRGDARLQRGGVEDQNPVTRSVGGPHPSPGAIFARRRRNAAALSQMRHGARRTRNIFRESPLALSQMRLFDKE